jgi:hypothetical protein
MIDSTTASTSPALEHNNPSNPLVKVNLSTLQQLAHYGFQINECQEHLSTLKAIAATQPLTDGEERAKNTWEDNIEHILGVLKSRAEQFESMASAKVAA